MKKSLKTRIFNVVYSPLCSKLVALIGVQKLYADLHVRSVKRSFLSNARKEFKKKSALGNFDDYKQAMKKHWVSYTEYAHQYEFYKKTEAEREEYISRLKMSYFYRRYTPGAAKTVFHNKTKFLKTFEKYVHRQWLYVPDSSFEDFEKMVSNMDCIMKPCDGKLGKGIFKTFQNNDHKNDRDLYEKCVKDRILAEQCIEACDELKAFHPQSLNTIRVVTIANKEKACVFSGVFRMGVGESVVDNSHKGGVSAQINVETGIVETDGANTHGDRFERHPDSGISIPGFQIPKWKTIVETCCEAAKLTENPITGWDVVINKHGEVEFIEGNYGPDMDMMQTRYKTGAKKKIHALVKEYCGITMKD